MKNGKVIRFDWAIKYLLRDKANFDILEGFLSAVLNRQVTVVELLESEGNKERKKGKLNRVDLLVRVSYDELVLIEVQVESELDFFHRIVYGTFGVNDGDTLGLSLNQKKAFGWDDVRQVFPEHYIIRVEKFGDEVKSAIDEWIYMLKNSEVKPEFESRNIQAASKKLKLMALDEEEQQAYKSYMEDERYHNSMVWSSHEEGLQQGLRKGREEGREQKNVEVVKNALQQGLSVETIAAITKIEADDVRRIEQELMQS